VGRISLSIRCICAGHRKFWFRRSPPRPLQVCCVHVCMYVCM
jgi:hypothetical protein